MKIAIGNDHSATSFKKELIAFLENEGHTVINCGTDSTESTDYPIYAKSVSKTVLDKDADFGVLICGTGIGISIAANKIKGIRAALVTNEYCARLSRQHNNANIIVFGARVLGLDLAKSCLREFLKTDFEGGRHTNRLCMLEEDCGYNEHI